MSLNITLPDKIEALLRRRAKAKKIPVEQLALGILINALEAEGSFPEPGEVVARIRATPPNPRSVRPATGSLAEALRNAPEDPDFDLAAWNQAWAAVETNMKTVTRANDIAEGRE
jgi:hypothetical protein